MHSSDTWDCPFYCKKRERNFFTCLNFICILLGGKQIVFLYRISNMNNRGTWMLRGCGVWGRDGNKAALGLIWRWLSSGCAPVWLVVVWGVLISYPSSQYNYLGFDFAAAQCWHELLVMVYICLTWVEWQVVSEGNGSLLSTYTSPDGWPLVKIPLVLMGIVDMLGGGKRRSDTCDCTGHGAHASGPTSGPL